ncbi:hypothetical protein CP061683_0495B, partial [Chlamydia psittaci 06-1683]
TDFSKSPHREHRLPQYIEDQKNLLSRIHLHLGEDADPSP